VIILYEENGLVLAEKDQVRTSLGITDVSMILRTKESEKPVSQQEVEEQI
jgi:hypothetical protein